MASRGPFSKSWDELSFSDNFIFCKVLENKDLCKQLLEKLLHLKIEKIDDPICEKTELINFKTKSIRYDVYVREATGLRVFDLEMQTGNYENLLLRARYYQSGMDAAETPVNMKYKDIKETYIIFICTEDPFKLGSPSYTKKIIFEERPDFNFNDKTHLIIYNASGYKEEKNSEVKSILKFISEKEADTDFTNKLKATVEETKKIPGLEGLYMEFINEIYDLEYKAEERGLKKGKEETALNMLRRGKMTLEEIAEDTKLPLEKINQLAKEALITTTK